jgi:hypothetical protein
MPIDALPPAQQPEARRLLAALQQAAAPDLEELACLLAGKDDADLLGATEFEVRGRAHRLGARAIEAALAGRKKRGTTGPAGPARAAAGRPSSSGGRPGGS